MFDQAIYSDMQLNTSVSEYMPKVMKEMQPAISERNFIWRDLGLGFDLGLTYYPKRTFSLPVSLMSDLCTAKMLTFTYKGYYKYEGIKF
jgi:hypothetical protein